MEADHRSVLPQFLRALPELHYGDASVNPQGPSTGPVVNLPRSERCLLSHRDPPSRQTLPTLLSQRHLLAVHSTAIRVVNQSESIYSGGASFGASTFIDHEPWRKASFTSRCAVVNYRFCGWALILE